jgi:hypothetical protein
MNNFLAPEWKATQKNKTPLKNSSINSDQTYPQKKNEKKETIQLMGLFFIFLKKIKRNEFGN